MRTGLYGGLTTLALLLLCTGCATLPTRAEIPLGEWSGHGRFVTHKWAADDKKPDASQPVSEHGEYPTRLSIEPARVGDHDGVRIEILSERGETESLPGDRTHIVALLRPKESFADGAITLYDLVEFGLETSKKPPKTDKGPEEATLATCMYSGGEIVLRVHYPYGFVDTLRFRDNVVFKDGAYFDSKEGLIHWSERLQRRH